MRYSKAKEVMLDRRSLATSNLSFVLLPSLYSRLYKSAGPGPKER